MGVKGEVHVYELQSVVCDVIQQVASSHPVEGHCVPDGLFMGVKGDAHVYELQSVDVCGVAQQVVSSHTPLGHTVVALPAING